MKPTLCLGVVLALTLVIHSGSAAQKPVWQQRCDWCITDRSGADGVGCPEQYEQTLPECLTLGGRACLMEKGIAAAKAKDDARAFTLALICQCHDQEALNDVNAAGAKNVADYLRTK